MAPTKTPKQAKAEELHATSKITEVLLDKVQVDLSYQRAPSRQLYEEIAGDWDVVASELVLISDRGPRTGGKVEGGLFCVNGQHRMLAAKLLGMETIWARVVNLRREPNPAMIEAQFRLKTNVRLGDRPLERFKAQLAAGDEQSHAIRKLLAKFDTEINTVANSEFGINCVSTIEALYNYDGGSLLEDTLNVMVDAYGQVYGKHASSALFKGIAWFIEAHSTGVDRKRLVDRLKATQVVALEARAKTHASIMGKSLWFNIYRTIVELYNEKLTRGRLEVISRGANRMAQNSSNDWSGGGQGRSGA